MRKWSIVNINSQLKLKIFSFNNRSLFEKSTLRHHGNSNLSLHGSHGERRPSPSESADRPSHGHRRPSHCGQPRPTVMAIECCPSRRASLVLATCQGRNSDAVCLAAVGPGPGPAGFTGMRPPCRDKIVRALSVVKSHFKRTTCSETRGISTL